MFEIFAIMHEPALFRPNHKGEISWLFPQS